MHLRVNGRDRGATLPIVALLLPVLILMTAFAIDLGRQRSSRRTMQARADIISLDLLRLADGRTEDQILVGDATRLSAEAALVQSAARNNVERAKITSVEWGTWIQGRVPLPFKPTLGGELPNAVEVTAAETTKYFFQPGSGGVVRSAIATQDDFTRLSLGSILLQADLGNAALLNPILTGLLCGVTPPSVPHNPLCPRQATFSAVAYDGLANAHVTLEDLAQAGSFGSVDDLLQEDLTVNDFARLTATALQNNGDPTTANLYDGGGSSLAGLTSASSATFKIEDVMSVESPASGASAAAALNPFEILVAGLQVANGSNLIDLSTAIPALTLPAGVSGLTLKSRYQIIETPRTGEGRVGGAFTRPPYLRTAQVRLIHELTFNLSVSVLGTGVTGPVTLPIDVNGGGSEATLTAINCAQPEAASTIDVTVAPRPLVGAAGRPFSVAVPDTIGTMNLTVAGLPAGSVGLSAYGAVDPALQTTGATPLADIAINETRSAPGSAFALGGALTNIKLQTALGGLSSLQLAIGTTLNGLLGALDAASRPAMGALGLSVSSSDVRNIDVDCQGLRLAA